ncbi:MAG: 1-phosphofructokinase family hexose kinase [Nitrospirae bacterium]|nr:1-phosphofructokinase family hexose kinase [Nitrospirota bacterium]
MNGPSAPDRPIATLTLNPAVDVSYEVSCLVSDQKSHATATRTDPGGNGINVGRALRVLGVPAGNYTLMAGSSGVLLETLLEDQIDHVVCEKVAGETRINATILQADPPAQYEVTGIGPFVSPEVLAKILKQFLDHVGGGYGVLSGSVPPGVPSDIYGSMVRRVRECGGFAVVDAHGDLLRQSLVHRPFLIKPNRYELSLLLGKDVPRIEDVAEEARILVNQGIRYVCVSLGAEGAILSGTEGSFLAKSPPVTVRCTVGSGDSMVAGLIASLSRGESAGEALRLAVACGSGTAAQPGTAIFTADQIRELLPRTSVTPL